MRSTMLCVIVVFLMSTASQAVNCTQRLGETGFRFDSFTDPATAVALERIEQEQGLPAGVLSPRITIPEGLDSISLQTEYCGDFELIGDFSNDPIWEFWNIGGWIMIANPDDTGSLLGNLEAPPPSGWEILPDVVTSTTVDLGDHRIETQGVFDTSDMVPGDYVVGITGSYVLAEPVVGEPGRVREQVWWERGFPLTVVPVPEPSGATLLWLAALFAGARVRNRRCRPAGLI